MPIYAYRCDSCGVRKDVLQKVSDAPLAECTECGAPGFRKELSAPAFQLKGSGWYVTDFRDNGKPKDKAAGASASEDGAGKPEGGKPDPITPEASKGESSGNGSGKAEGAKAPSGAASGAPASGSASASNTSTPAA